MRIAARAAFGLFALLAIGCNTAFEDRPRAARTVANDALAMRAMERKAELAEAARLAPFRYAAMPENPRPGYPVAVAVTAGHGVRAAALFAAGRRLGTAAFFPVDPGDGSRAFLATVIAIPTTINASAATIVLEGPEGPMAEIPLFIEGRQFRSETINLTPALTGIITDDSRERAEQAAHLWAILDSVGEETHFFDAFVFPVNATRRTSVFGSRRVFMNANGTSSLSIHAGIDYGVPTGTPVFASGAGRVVLARERIVSGRSVIIEHLPGVFSLYYHLDSIGVNEGETIAAGAVLGLSGTTGLSTGPHLHWEVRVFGENTDPDALVARPLLDIPALLSMLGD